MHHMGRYQHAYKLRIIHFRMTSTSPGSVDELAAMRKVTKCASLPATYMYNYVPIVLESLSPINTTGLEFITELGRRIRVTATGDPLETR